MSHPDPSNSGSASLPSRLGDKLEAVLNICEKLGSEHHLPVLLDLIARDTARLLEADRASIFLLDRLKGELWSQVALGSEPIRFDASQGIAGACVQKGETINVVDVREHPLFFAGVDADKGYETRSILALPLRNHTGEIVGAFEVLNRKEGSFTEDDEVLARALASQAAVAIETAQLVEELQKHRDQLIDENTQLRKEVEEKFSTRNILGGSEKLQAVLRLIDQIRDSSVDVLITGESGTGKELYAKAIHYSSPRAHSPLVALNCAAMPDNLLESELFGIEKGVATGVDRKPGKFELAHGGTLFLDEIGDLSLAAQAKILRALQERTVERVGGRKSIDVDVRVLAATNKDLEAEIAKGEFREDLYYRLKVVHLETPALREIADDVPILANHFLEHICGEMGKPRKKFSPKALQTLRAYGWPGNVRQLENEVKRLVAVIREKVIEPEHLSESIQGRDAGRVASGNGRSLREVVEELERQLIRDALDAEGYNQVRAARALGLSRQGLIKKMKRYEIDSGSRAGARKPQSA